MMVNMPFLRSFFDANRAIGKPVDLPPESEEVASFFAAMIDTDHAQNDTFRANFFKDWQDILKEHPPVRFL
jgi:DNA topoisomerase IB